MTDYNEKSIGYAEDDIDALRKVPQMYGPVSDKGYLHMIKEIFQNSIDEAAQIEKDMTISIDYEELTHRVTIDDDGRGIPVGENGETLIKLFTMKHSSGKGNWVDGGSYNISAGVHGIGTKLCNALSKELKVVASRDGIKTMTRFEKGRLVEEPNVIGKSKKSGTYIEFVPDMKLKTAFPSGKIKITADDVFDMVETLAYLTPIGTTIKFHATRVGKEGEMNKTIKNKDGINSLLKKQLNSALIKPIVTSGAAEDMGHSITFTYDTKMNEDIDFEITSFANYCTTTKGGTHVDGFKSAIGYFFSKEVKGMLSDNDKKKINISHRDCWNSLSAVIDCWHVEPKLETQTKDTMGQEEMIGYIKNVTTKALKQFKKENRKDFDKICAHIKKMSEIRSRAVNAKRVAIKEVKDDTYFSNFVKNFVRATGGKGVKKELFIVEGDSAKGSGRDSRDKETQAIFPVRGKSLNTLGLSETNILKNAEFQNLIKILKTNIGSKFNIDKCEYDKIIIMADADPDGSHIFSLLATFFIYHMPEIVDKGMLYKAVAPLYSFKGEKGKMIYVTSYREYLEYVEKSFSKDNEMGLNGVKLKSQDSIDILFKNRDYYSTIQRTADLLAINPVLLEYIIYGMDKPNFNKLLTDKFQFMKTEAVGKAIVVSGVIDKKYQMIIVENNIMTKAKKAIECIRETNYNNIFVELNGVQHTLFELMTVLKAYEPSGKYRMKGLGEMDSHELYNTTMCPDSRTLIKLSYDDLEAEYVKFNSIMGSDAELKREIMQKFKISDEDIDN